MRISCGTNWAEALPLNETAALIAAAGYEAVDLVWPVASDLGPVQQLLEHASLAAASVTVLADFGDSRELVSGRLVEAAALARGLGLNSLSIISGDRRRRSVQEWAGQLERILAELDDLALELINRCTSRMEQLEDFRELFIRVGDSRLGVAVDTLEFHRASVDPRGAVGESADRITRVILRDAVGNRQVPLGEGEVNIHSVLTHAAQIGDICRLCLDPLVLSRQTAVEDLAAERRRLEALLAAGV